jgi:PAS domain S-box-containing protein
VAGGSALALSALGWLAVTRGRRVLAERQRRRMAEHALADAEALLARSFTRHPEAMLLIGRHDGCVRDANQALLALLGLQAPALIGQPLAALDGHVDAAALAHLVRTLAADGVLDGAPLTVRGADGRLHPCLVSADTLRIGGADQVFCIVRDISEQLARDDQLRASYEALAQRLQAELAQARQALDEAQQGLVRAEGALQAFTRSVAHDLRTPLNAVTGFIGLLRLRLQDGHVQEALGYSQHIERAALRMNAMITALAALGRVGQNPLQRRHVDMRQLAHDTVALLGAARPTPPVACHIADLPPTQADPDLAAQVWQNLIDNAWKYSAKVPAPRLAVDSFRDARGQWYRVTDNGAGFDMARAERLFQPFQRMHSEQQFAGTGVGLSLVRRIVDHHGGEIRLRSAPGVGTVAEFTLDAAPGPQTGAA